MAATQIPDHIPKPDYYLTGYPASEMESRQQHAGAAAPGGAAEHTALAGWLLPSGLHLPARHPVSAAGLSSPASPPTCLQPAVKIRTEKDVAGIREACRIGREVRAPGASRAGQPLPVVEPVPTPPGCPFSSRACSICAQVLDAAAAAIQPGITTDEIDRIVRRRAVPAALPAAAVLPAVLAAAAGVHSVQRPAPDPAWAASEGCR